MTEQPSFARQPLEKRRLLDEHVQLDSQCAELISHTIMGDWRDCDSIWDTFSRNLERHMSYEEDELFPAYAKSSQAAALTVQQLDAEHTEFRQRLGTIGVDIQLHLVRVEVLQELVDLLLDHARREGQSMYPWIDEQTARHEPPFGCEEALL